jgi:signal transduction histidine kinase
MERSLFPKKLTFFAAFMSLCFFVILTFSFYSFKSLQEDFENFYFPVIEYSSINIRLIDDVKFNLKLFALNKSKDIDSIKAKVNTLKQTEQLYKDLFNGSSLDFNDESFNQLIMNYEEIVSLYEKGKTAQAVARFESKQFQDKINMAIDDIRSITVDILEYRDSVIEENKTYLNSVIIFSSAFFILIIFTWLKVYRAYIENYKKMLITEGELESERVISFQNAKLASIGELAGGIAHEINNPLTIISGSVNKMKKLYQVDKLTDEEFDYNIQRIIGTIRRITRIINSLRKLSRNSSNDPFEEISAELLLNETMDFIAEKLRNHRVELIVENSIEENLLFCHSLEIQQIMINLINNSFDEIEGQENSWIKISLTEDSEYSYICVEDSGKGIALDKREQVMQPFFTTKEIGKGTGLGLSLSRRLATQNNGDLYLEPETEKTIFTLRLPHSNKNLAEAA